jgi:hypothetical protein
MSFIVLFIVVSFVNPVFSGAFCASLSNINLGPNALQDNNKLMSQLSLIFA